MPCSATKSNLLLIINLLRFFVVSIIVKILHIQYSGTGSSGLYEIVEASHQHGILALAKFLVLRI